MPKSYNAEYQALLGHISHALGHPARRSDFEVQRMGTRAERLAEVRDNGCAMPVRVWAIRLSEAAAEREGWSEAEDEHKRLAAEAQFFSLLTAKAATLPLRELPSRLLRPKELPLPERWQSALWLDKAELRAWAKEHAPDLLEFGLLAEPEPAPAGQSPAEQWKLASAERKRVLAAEARRLHGTQEKAAASLGITRQRLAEVLRNSSATVASAFPKSPWNPHKT